MHVQVTLFTWLQIYGKENHFNAARLVDLLGAYETFKVASNSARGSLDEGRGMPAVAVPGAAATGAAGEIGGPTQHGSYRPQPFAWGGVRTFPPLDPPCSYAIVTLCHASCLRN